MSSGGWSVLAAAAGLLAGAYAHRVSWPGTRVRDLVFGGAAGIAAAAGAIGVGLVTADLRPAGFGLLLVAAVYIGLSGRRVRARELPQRLDGALVARTRAPDRRRVVDRRGLGLAHGRRGCDVARRRGARAHRCASGGSGSRAASLAVATSVVVLTVQVQPWLAEGELERRVAIASAALALATFGLAALVWGQERWRDLCTIVWATGILAAARDRAGADRRPSTRRRSSSSSPGRCSRSRRAPWARRASGSRGRSRSGRRPSRPSRPGPRPTTCSRRPRARPPVSGCWPPASSRSEWPQSRLPTSARRSSSAQSPVALALYAVSLGILELAERASTASVETDFERGHTAVSGIWALVGLGLLVVGLLRGSALLRYGGSRSSASASRRSSSTTSPRSAPSRGRSRSSSSAACCSRAASSSSASPIASGPGRPKRPRRARPRRARRSSPPAARRAAGLVSATPAPTELTRRRARRVCGPPSSAPTGRSRGAPSGSPRSRRSASARRATSGMRMRWRSERANTAAACSGGAGGRRVASGRARGGRRARARVRTRGGRGRRR